ncbi:MULTISPECIES: membrane-bound PQQ-dependent dehydrogenase, glucose/quinate/shikimate family [unclassified Marinobacter]|jgi:quinoprotein glucose dehydrogenase|uniref:membrane-bound PQQ-dependent dehydrogenase, glucose/quinate/shikimate family n=1 Tax=unclassified Marinobacter TaxID=83889 RepID=UPI00200FF24B|nr:MULTISPECIES: membrane-bound PQQ-dependent dehydrogenase, glucose/quinate/shikimate family [unclassified Marinobacter]MCL1481920.1 membrane-bound PQQ-dependent dehydrogenase, glucose/quinate/shikimate family [Marinobacter sp.]MCL1484460.1 membrane-bound PQQ-dependent dehydrogenase, glucose/quinate/shikimate family [Marinobacter sp.]UQG57903.1 membrane-bound PQQ-dependent dehydrogenase, glucose/quinate/shikimate family [Marinobacter sp. M4C]UQG66708.1 membrane-bound PQQ-dependent dehydrogenas
MIVLSIILLLLGLVLLAGGVWLISLGGSLYYAIAGIALIIAGLTAKTRRPTARWVYALFLAATAIWALWESGLDWWPLATRLGLFLLLAIPLLFPGPKAQRGGAMALVPVWVVVGLITVSSLAFDQHRIDGQLNEDSVFADPEMGDISDDSWHAYGRSNMGQRYSPLDQITVENAGTLEKAWVYQTGDLQGPKDVGEITYEATPLKIGNSLYVCTPHNWLIALDADTGEEQWVYDAKVPMESQRQHQTCRGVSYLPPAEGDANNISARAINEPAEELASVQCDAQLFLPTSDARLIAVDPETGARCSNFADDGELDLLHNMPFKQAGFYYATSPPVVANGVVVVSGAVNDNYDIDSPSGVIRAYDVKTGELEWNWDPGHPENTDPIAEDETYSKSSPNSWAVASADEELGLIYFPMGNRVPDQLGWYRSENDEKFASSVVALSLETGEVAWVQQFVHHDLWDMDTPAQPSLVDLKTEKGREPALVVPTKQGDVYVLNRETGEPIIPVTEQKAPQGTVEEDYASAMQPISGLNFRPPELTEADMWGASAVDQMICRITFRSLRYEGQYTPPSEQGTIVYPGNFGVFNWGGIAVDPERQVMFGMPLYLAFTSKLIPKEGADLGETNQGEQGVNENAGAPYAVEMKPFLSPLGIPCQQPPWGYVAGADLRTGEVVWKQKNGTIYDMTPLPLPIEIGVPGIGGPIITGGGVAFLAASVDNYLRAYDLTTGEQLWEERLPAGGQATPMTYLNSKGEQMVVLVAGGHGSIGTTFGDYVIAYKLP